MLAIIVILSSNLIRKAPIYLSCRLLWGVTASGRFEVAVLLAYPSDRMQRHPVTCLPYASSGSWARIVFRSVLECS